MKKFSLRVSGSRVGDAARPSESSTPIPLIKAPRFGLKVHRSPLAPKPSTPLTADDYATGEDYDARPDVVGPRSAAEWPRGGQ